MALQSFLTLTVVYVLHIFFKSVIIYVTSTDQEIPQANIANIANTLFHLNANEGFAVHRAQHRVFCHSLCCALFVLPRVVVTIG